MFTASFYGETFLRVSIGSSYTVSAPQHLRETLKTESHDVVYGILRRVLDQPLVDDDDVIDGLVDFAVQQLHCGGEVLTLRGRHIGVVKTRKATLQWSINDGKLMVNNHPFPTIFNAAWSSNEARAYIESAC